MTVEELTAHINSEDKKVALAIEKALPQINKLIAAIANKLEAGGRMFYLVRQRRTFVGIRCY